MTFKIRPLAPCETPAETKKTASLTAWDRGMAIEKKALEYLIAQKGMSFLEQNYRVNRRTNRAEIDLIFLERTDRGVELVFFEVRSRTEGKSFGTPEESLDGMKRLYLERAMEHFLWKEALRLPKDLKAIRLDLLGWDGSEWRWTKDVRRV